MSNAETPHYHGHRQRLRDKFLNNSDLPDYELLELLLFQGNPRRDVKPLAKKLLSHFGSLGRVLSATSEQLREFKLNPGSVLSLRLSYKLHLRLIEDLGLERTHVLQSLDEIIQFCHHRLAPLSEEAFYVLYLDSKKGLIRHDLLQLGTVNKVAIYPREILKTALTCGATHLVLSHNHPGGDPTPSFNDIKLTHEVQSMCRPLEIKVIDHIIVGHSKTISLKQLGKL